jgi:hypothetical protein
MHLTGLPEKQIYYTLRAAVSMCFIGHGAFGLITKPIWCNYFAVFGIGHNTAYHLMPFVGSVDILLGVLMIFYPLRAIPIWLVIWGFATACLRPLSGEPFAELIERAGNFGAPLALLLLTGGFSLKSVFSPIGPNFKTSGRAMHRVIACLQIIVFLLLAGHGWLNLIEKKGLVQQYASLGFPNPGHLAVGIGTLEILAAFGVLIKPLRPLILFLFAWKILSELFYPHYELFEWIERAGSYGCLFAFWLALGTVSDKIWQKKPHNNWLFLHNGAHT